jgi:hypothetical protein
MTRRSPIGKTQLEPMRFEAMCTEQLNRFIGKHAVWSTTVGDHLDPFLQGWKERLKFGDGGGPRTGNVSGLKLGLWTHVEQHGLATLEPDLQFLEADGFIVTREAAGDETINFSEARLSEVAQILPEWKCTFGQPVKCEYTFTALLKQAGGVQHLQVLAGVGNGQVGFSGQVFNAAFTLREQFEQFEAVVVGERFADTGEVRVKRLFEFAFPRVIHIQ